MGRKIKIVLSGILLLGMLILMINARNYVKGTNTTSTEISSSDDADNDKQTRADLIFLELLEKTLFRSR
jgi:hypothetical protein